MKEIYGEAEKTLEMDSEVDRIPEEIMPSFSNVAKQFFRTKDLVSNAVRGAMQEVKSKAGRPEAQVGKVKRSRVKAASEEVPIEEKPATTGSKRKRG